MQGCGRNQLLPTAHWPPLPVAIKQVPTNQSKQQQNFNDYRTALLLAMEYITQTFTHQPFVRPAMKGLQCELHPIAQANRHTLNFVWARTELPSELSLWPIWARAAVLNTPLCSSRLGRHSRPQTSAYVLATLSDTHCLYTVCTSVKVGQVWSTNLTIIIAGHDMPSNLSWHKQAETKALLSVAWLWPRQAKNLVGHCF